MQQEGRTFTMPGYDKQGMSHAGMCYTQMEAYMDTKGFALHINPATQDILSMEKTGINIALINLCSDTWLQADHHLECQ